MTSFRLLNNGAEAFTAMFASIERARSCIALEMYTVCDDGTGTELRDRLARSAQRGVQVMVLIDAWGSWELPDSFWNNLKAAGGAVRRFHPVFKKFFPFRNHRKMLLIDDHTVYIGGMNIADEYRRGSSGQAPWRDNMLEISGPEVARLRRSFTRMWGKADLPLSGFLSRGLNRPDRALHTPAPGKVRFLESGPEDPMRPVRRMYGLIIHQAARTIDLAMGYFYPHGRIMRALKRAVRRGVRVRLLFPLKTDVPTARWAARGLYGRMLRSGVEVWEYQPAMMHAKLAVADDTVIAGSANLDIRSGMINYELVVVIHDRELAASARSDFEEDLRSSVRVELEDWKKRPFWQKVKERFSYCLLARADIFFSRSAFGRRTLIRR